MNLFVNSFLIVFPQNLHYDLGDCTLWEFMFPSNEKPQLAIPEEEDLMDDMDDEVTQGQQGPISI